MNSEGNGGDGLWDKEGASMWMEVLWIDMWNFFYRRVWICYAFKICVQYKDEYKLDQERQYHATEPVHIITFNLKAVLWRGRR